MLRAVADTHAVIWYIFGDHRLSPAAQRFIEEAASNGDQSAFSSITLAEMVYLSEKGRIAPFALNRLLEAVEQEESVLVEVPFDHQIALALREIPRHQVPDLPDRMIGETALHLGLPIITRDRRIQVAGLPAIW